MITPKLLNQIASAKYDISKIEKEIDKILIDDHGMYPWEEAILDMDLPVDIRNTIAKHYIDCGWTYVYHQTSYENGERRGLTVFVFSLNPVESSENNKWYKITKSSKEVD